MKDAIRVNRKCAGARDPEVCAAVTNMWYNPPVSARNCGQAVDVRAEEPPTRAACLLDDIVHKRHAQLDALEFRKAVAWAQDTSSKLPRPAVGPGAPLPPRCKLARLDTSIFLQALAPLHAAAVLQDSTPHTKTCGQVHARRPNSSDSESSAAGQLSEAIPPQPGQYLLQASAPIASLTPPQSAPAGTASAYAFRLPQLTAVQAMRACFVQPTSSTEPPRFLHTSLHAPSRALPAAACLCGSSSDVTDTSLRDAAFIAALRITPRPKEAVDLSQDLCISPLSTQSPRNEQVPEATGALAHGDGGCMVPASTSSACITWRRPCSCKAGAACGGLHGGRGGGAHAVVHADCSCTAPASTSDASVVDTRSTLVPGHAEHRATAHQKPTGSSMLASSVSCLNSSKQDCDPTSTCSCAHADGLLAVAADGAATSTLDMHSSVCTRQNDSGPLLAGSVASLSKGEACRLQLTPSGGGHYRHSSPACLPLVSSAAPLCARTVESSNGTLSGSEHMSGMSLEKCGALRVPDRPMNLLTAGADHACDGHEASCGRPATCELGACPCTHVASGTKGPDLVHTTASMSVLGVEACRSGAGNKSFTVGQKCDEKKMHIEHLHCVATSAVRLSPAAGHATKERRQHGGSLVACAVDATCKSGELQPAPSVLDQMRPQLEPREGDQGRNVSQVVRQQCGTVDSNTAMHISEVGGPCRVVSDEGIKRSPLRDCLHEAAVYDELPNRSRAAKAAVTPHACPIIGSASTGASSRSEVTSTAAATAVVPPMGHLLRPLRIQLTQQAYPSDASKPPLSSYSGSPASIQSSLTAEVPPMAPTPAPVSLPSGSNALPLFRPVHSYLFHPAAVAADMLPKGLPHPHMSARTAATPAAAAAARHGASPTSFNPKVRCDAHLSKQASSSLVSVPP
jgi:hypothetical protein